MGVHNVEQAGLLAAQKALGHRAARLLLWMANRALDEAGDNGAEPRLYFAGPTHLAIGLGYAAPENGSPTALRKVRAALAELEGAGLISRSGAYAGHQQVYELQLPPKPARRPLAVLDTGRPLARSRGA